MKKWLTGGLVAAMILTFALPALAETASADGTGQTSVKANASAQLQQKREARQQKLQFQITAQTDLQSQRAAIEQNRLQIVQLKAEMLKLHGEATAHIQQLRKSGTKLTPEQLAALKQAANTLKTNRTLLRQSVGEIKVETQSVKSARKDQNLEQMKASLEKIAVIQTERIQILQKGIADIQKILAI